MAEPLDRMASWPRHLQASWRDCVERGEVDAQNPPASIVEAYLQVAEAQQRRGCSSIQSSYLDLRFIGKHRRWVPSSPSTRTHRSGRLWESKRAPQGNFRRRNPAAEASPPGCR